MNKSSLHSPQLTDIILSSPWYVMAHSGGTRHCRRSTFSENFWNSLVLHKQYKSLLTVTSGPLVKSLFFFVALEVDVVDVELIGVDVELDTAGVEGSAGSRSPSLLLDARTVFYASDAFLAFSSIAVAFLLFLGIFSIITQVHISQKTRRKA